MMNDADKFACMCLALAVFFLTDPDKIRCVWNRRKLWWRELKKG
jgi:hypothetical protein